MANRYGIMGAYFNTKLPLFSFELYYAIILDYVYIHELSKIVMFLFGKVDIFW